MNIQVQCEHTSSINIVKVQHVNIQVQPVQSLQVQSVTYKFTDCELTSTIVHIQVQSVTYKYNREHTSTICEHTSSHVIQVESCTYKFNREHVQSVIKVQL